MIYKIHIAGRMLKRNRAKSHIYVDNDDSDTLPMCHYGWNHLRGLAIRLATLSTRGLCKICVKRLEEGRESVTWGE